MLIDLLSPTEYGQFNRKLAHILGLKESIFLSELMSVCVNSRSEDCSVVLTTNVMEKIFNRTTLCQDEQKEFVKKFVEMGLVKREGQKTVVLPESITSLVMADNEKLEKALKLFKEKKEESAAKPTKEEVIRDNLRGYINYGDCEVLRDAYYDWIDSVIAKDGFMTKVAVESAQKTINTYPHINLQVALEILRIASVNGWRDINWAIKSYEQGAVFKSLQKINATYTSMEKQKNGVKLSEEVF